MNRYLAGRALTCALLLSGCASQSDWKKPDVTSEDFAKLKNLVYSMECELGEAVAKVPHEYRFLADQDALGLLNLKVTEAPSADGRLSFNSPVGASSLTLALAGSKSGTSTRTMEVQAKFNPKDARECTPKTEKELEVSRIEGGLGLDQWITELVTLMEVAGRLPAFVSYSTSFVLTTTPSGGLTFVNSDQDFTVPLNASRRREVTHTVSLTVKGFRDPRAASSRSSNVPDPGLQNALRDFTVREALQNIAD